jgi:hypothetical protein
MGGVSRVGTVFSGGRGGGDFARGTGKVAELRDEAPRQGGGSGGKWRPGLGPSSLCVLRLCGDF